MTKPKFFLMLVEGSQRKLSILKDSFVNNLLCFSFSYGDISSKTMFQDMHKIVFGGFLMFLFMILVLSKFGWIELRVSVFIDKKKH